MQLDQLPDWRIYFAASIGEIRGPNPVGAKPGDIMLPITETKTPEDGLVSLPVVSPYRLALSIAIGAACNAKQIRKRVRFLPPPKGMKSKSLDYTTTPALYDYFEQCMVAATFSYQALETYSNETIEQHLRDGKSITLERKRGPEIFDASGAQRELSTEEKIAAVLPMLLDLPLDKSSKMWQEFTILRRVRDSIIHLKTTDRYVRGAVDRETVFYRLLNNQPRRYVRSGLNLMRHFSGGAELSWLDFAEERLTNA